MKSLVAGLALALMLGGCTEEVGGTGGEGGDVLGGGTPLVVDVPDGGPRMYIDLDKPEVVEVADPYMSYTWDLAIEGWELFTSSGPSGPGDGGAFGPLDLETFVAGERPSVPFIIDDEAGGAFVRWWAYDGEVHVIYSRFHVYGVRDAQNRLFKVQIITFYGEVQGAPVSAIYQLRWAEVTASGSGPTQTITDLDATAGGVDTPPDAPSGCLDLATGDRLMLTPQQAIESSAWHLCLRRDNISVNGELGGPGGVAGVDVDAAHMTTEETVEQVKQFTAESELPRFDATDQAALEDPALVYRGDRIVSAFGTRWYDAGKTPREPRPVSWMVVSADGEGIFLLAFEKFEGATDTTPGRVHMRIKRVR
jgi:hypothetical protein